MYKCIWSAVLRLVEEMEELVLLLVLVLVLVLVLQLKYAWGEVPQWWGGVA